MKDVINEKNRLKQELDKLNTSSNTLKVDKSLEASNDESREQSERALQQIRLLRRNQ